MHSCRCRKVMDDRCLRSVWPPYLRCQPHTPAEPATPCSSPCQLDDSAGDVVRLRGTRWGGLGCRDSTIRPWPVNVADVTIDPLTGEPREQRPEDLLTKICATAYNPKATCPLWVSFLERIFAGNEALIGSIKRAVGYSLTGDTSEQVILFLYGTGANGKTTFLSTVTTLVGDYAQWTEFSTFLLKNRDAIRNDLAALKGARFVSAAESQQGRRFDETVIK